MPGFSPGEIRRIFDPGWSEYVDGMDAEVHYLAGLEAGGEDLSEGAFCLGVELDALQDGPQQIEALFRVELVAAGVAFRQSVKLTLDLSAVVRGQGGE